MPSAVMDSFLLQLVILLACVTWSGTATKLFIGANWKCSLESVEDVDRQVESLNNMWSSLDKAEKDAIELCINPPFVYLDRVRTKLHKEISVGRQNAQDARGHIPDRRNTGATTMAMIRSVCSGLCENSSALPLLQFQKENGRASLLPTNLSGPLGQDLRHVRLKRPSVLMQRCESLSMTRLAPKPQSHVVLPTQGQ